MKKPDCYLLYDYLTQLPVGVFENVKEMSIYLGRTKEVTMCGITRVNQGRNKFITDKNGNKYEPYRIYFMEEC